MAWPEKLRSGKWRGCYRDLNGDKQSIPGTFDTEFDAARAAWVKEDEVRKRPRFLKNAGKMPYGEWWEQWFPARDVEPGTARGDESRGNLHVLPYWRDKPLEKHTLDKVQEWYDTLKETEATKATPKGKGEERAGRQHRTGAGRTLSVSTRLKIFNLYSSSMKAAHLAGRIPYNPCTGVKVDRSDPAANEKETFLTRDQHTHAREHAVDGLTRFFLDLGVGTGGRWGELVGLHVERISLEAKRVVIQEVYDLAKGEIKAYPKGGERRGVPISGALVAEIKQWMREHPPTPCRTRHRDGKPCRGHLLIASQNGTVLNYSNFRRSRWNPTMRAAGLDEVTPHDLRHTYASWLIQSGKVTIEQLQKLMGHKSITTTQRYAHLGEAGWDSVRDALDPAPQNADGSYTITDLAQEEVMREVLEQLVELNPAKWGPVLAALEGPALDLPHEDDPEEGGKVIPLDRFRRTSG